MKIIVASQNPLKVAAVEEVLPEYKNVFGDTPEVVTKPAPDEFGQPWSLTEVIEGAVHRAKSVFSDCDYSVGIEEGMMEAPHTKSGYINIGACVFYDGREVHLGLMAGFEAPRKVVELMKTKKLDMSQAFKEAGLTTAPKAGAVGTGIVGPLTKDRFPRQELIKKGLIMALIHLENPSLY